MKGLSQSRLDEARAVLQVNLFQLCIFMQQIFQYFYDFKPNKNRLFFTLAKGPSTYDIRFFGAIFDLLTQPYPILAKYKV